MRLMNTETQLLEQPSGPQAYAILSHTWGEDEVLFQDVEPAKSPMNIRPNRGWNKVLKACETARKCSPALKYIWIDTCCIDKNSSAELSEAINSMFQWYQAAEVCFAYLENVESATLKTMTLFDGLKTAKWFRRGWTLQELIAPNTVTFFSNDWDIIGTRLSLSNQISSITGISINVLMEPKLLPTISVARRMSWAAERETTRREDIAYCLMGIFNVNMPLLYGEGDKAFMRLQEEIIKDSEDQSLFAWQHPTDGPETGDAALQNEGIFAHHPIAFKAAYDIVPHPTGFPPSTITSRGLEIHIPICRGFWDDGSSAASHIGILTCHYENDLSQKIGIALDFKGNKYYRKACSALIFLQHEEAELAKSSTVHIHKWGKRQDPGLNTSYCYLKRHPSQMYHLSDAIAVEANISSNINGLDRSWDLNTLTIPWTRGNRTLQLAEGSEGHFGVLEFTQIRIPGSSRELANGFSIILRLFPHDFGIVKIIQWTRAEQISHNFLRTTLEEHFHAIAVSRNSIRIGAGTIYVGLEKTTELFNRDAYVVAIDYSPSIRYAPARMAVHRVPDIRLLEADG